MRAIKANLIVSVILASIFTSSILAAYFMNTDFGNITVQKISVASEHGPLEALLYRPNPSGLSTLQPAVVLAHGISGSKQFLSGIALELARNGIVALTIDLLGHGGSGGRVADGQEDPTFGMLAAVRYLEAQTFVNTSSLGLSGHSLGAGAARATAATHGKIRATVLIGGGFGSMVAGSAYGTLNSTFPQNLLVAVGKYDVLFNIDELRREILPSVFGTNKAVVLDTVYGSISDGSARKFITPATTHLFEPVDPVVTGETVQWVVDALQPIGSSGDRQSTMSTNYSYRDLAILIGLITLFALVLSVSSLALNFLHSPARQLNARPEKDPVLADWKVFVLWGGLSLILFLPMVFVGFAINFPPLVFGASIAWWTLGVAVAGFLVLLLLSRRSRTKSNIRRIISDAFDFQGVAIAISTLVLMYAISIVAGALLVLDLGIMAPFFRLLTPASRVYVFFMLAPFFLVYFTVEGLFLHVLRRPTQSPTVRDNIASLARTIGLKIGPYLAIVALQYIPLVLFGFQVFPGFAAFLNEFWWLLVPIFAVSTACSWWFYRITSRIGVGTVFNALVFAIIAAGLFPF